MTDQVSGAPGAVETPKSDFVLSDDQPQVQAPVKPQEETEPKKEAIEAEDEGEEDQEQDNPSDKGKPHKPKNGYKRKIEKLEAELAAIRAGLQPKPDPAPKADDKADGKPDPASFKTDAEYTEAFIDWRVKEAAKVQKEADSKKAREAAEDAAFAAKLSKYDQGIAAVKEANPDFDEAMLSVNEKRISQPIRAALIANEEIGPEIAYYLAKNPEILDKLNEAGADGLPKLSFNQVMREFGKIEARIESAKSNPVDVAAVKTTSAPPPIKPVAKGKSQVTVDPGEMSFEDFQVWERKQKNR